MDKETMSKLLAMTEDNTVKHSVMIQGYEQDFRNHYEKHTKESLDMLARYFSDRSLQLGLEHYEFKIKIEKSDCSQSTGIGTFARQKFNITYHWASLLHKIREDCRKIEADNSDLKARVGAYKSMSWMERLKFLFSGKKHFGWEVE